MLLRQLTLWLIFVALVGPVTAQTLPMRSVVADIDYVEHHDLHTTPYISVTCYYSGTSTCAGGGDFDLNTTISGSACTHQANGATLVADGRPGPDGPDCFNRDNFGLNGFADARQCGVAGDGRSSDVAALKDCMTLAANTGIFRVYTGGGIIVDNHSHPDGSGDYNFIIPQGMELTCRIDATADLKKNDFRIASGLMYAIVLICRIPSSCRRIMPRSLNAI